MAFIDKPIDCTAEAWRLTVTNNNSIMNTKEKIIKIINNHSPELAAEEILLLFGVSGLVCEYCGSIEVIESKNYDEKGRYFCKHCHFEHT
jgi:transposase-like protein